MANETANESKPAYVTYTTFENFINGLRESGIPNRIDKSVMGTMSGANQSFMMGALRFLRLITETGAPTEELKDLVTGDAKKALSEILQFAYHFLFNQNFNLKTATLSQVEEKFREKDLSGDTIRKAISFFTLACDAAGITYSPHLKGKRGVRGNGGNRRQKKQRAASGVLPEDNPTDLKSQHGYHPPQVLPLASDRKVTVTAPKDMTEQEIKRLARWLEVTFQIDWNDTK